MFQKYVSFISSGTNKMQHKIIFKWNTADLNKVLPSPRLVALSKPENPVFPIIYP